MSQPEFFDLDDRLEEIDAKDPLVGINELIDWEDFRAESGDMHCYSEVSGFR